MRKKINFLQIIALISIVIWGFYFVVNKISPSVSPDFVTYNQTDIKIGNVTVIADIAETHAQRVQGLSGRSSLGENEGMFFIFEKDGPQGIWMKNMLMPIDIIWIDKDFIVVHFEKNVSPDTYPESFKSPVDARYVLEVPAGFVEGSGVKLLEKVEVR